MKVIFRTLDYGFHLSRGSEVSGFKTLNKYTDSTVKILDMVQVIRITSNN